jgi:hypothetical protein
MKNQSNKKFPLKPGTDEFKKMYRHPIVTACLCLFGAIALIKLGEHNIIPQDFAHMIGLTLGIIGLPYVIATLRSALP